MIVRKPAFFAHVIYWSFFGPNTYKAKPDLSLNVGKYHKNLFSVVPKIFNQPTKLQLRVHMLSFV
jgi:hypothetical protein